MQILTHPHVLRLCFQKARRKSLRFGFIPTMGALHEGHLSLVRWAKKENDRVVVSIFVNPLQFGPHEDFSRYPRSLAGDQKLLEREGVDFLFLPTVKGFYPPDFQTSVSVTRFSQPLCGAARPTHFAGVCTVVLKLLHIVAPDTLYLGQKDYQQFRVLEQMVKDLDVPTQLQLCPIVREPDGVAMSSRNVLLSSIERKEARSLYRSLEKAREFIRAGVRDASRVRKMAIGILKETRHARVDYLEIVDAQTLQPMVKLKAGREVLIAAAVIFGKTRLIDNCLVRV